MRDFYARGAVATESLIRALQRDNDQYATDVLIQCFSVPKEYREALLTGAATWEVKSPSILTIGLAKGVSPSHPKQDDLGGRTQSM
jgi:hypothetical protein